MTYHEFFDEWYGDISAIKCHTSGSTGAPKEIFLSKEEMRDSAIRTINYFGLNENSHLHSCISPDFIGGKMMAVRAAVLGYDPYKNKNSIEFTFETPSNRPMTHYTDNSIDLLAVVPSQMLYIAQHSEEMPPINAILMGGGPSDNRLKELIIKKKLHVWESYGMTETSSHIALRKVDSNTDRFSLLPGIRIKSVDDCLQIEMPDGKILLTNDIVDIDADGKFKIIGRKDNVIITGGKKVNPEQMESVLSSIFNFPFAISWISDTKWGQKVVMVAQNPDIPDEQIIEECRKLFDNYMIPREIIKMEIPYTDNGKISRKKIEYFVNNKKCCKFVL